MFLRFPTFAFVCITCAAVVSPLALSQGRTKSKKTDLITELLFKNVIDRAFPLLAAKWDRTPVPVCWEDMAPPQAGTRDLVRKAAEATWATASRLKFSGWQQCAPNNQGIRILISDVGPHVQKLGKLVDGLKNGMVLNDTFAAWGQSCAVDDASKTACIVSIAVHEFGHAIGFAHEQNRPDTPGECQQPPQGPDGDTLTLTPWDANSVMNYCNQRYNNNGKLSDWDVYAVQYIYGRP